MTRPTHLLSPIMASTLGILQYTLFPTVNRTRKQIRQKGYCKSLNTPWESEVATLPLEEGDGGLYFAAAPPRVLPANTPRHCF
jgi:hypothetical protein